MTAKDRKFDILMLVAIDETLTSLGESAKQSIYFHIEKKFGVSNSDIPENLEKFQAGLEKIFGVGARFIEILIMKNLYTKIGLPLEMKQDCELEFVKYVAAAKLNYMKQ